MPSVQRLSPLSPRGQDAHANSHRQIGIARGRIPRVVPVAAVIIIELQLLDVPRQPLVVVFLDTRRQKIPGNAADEVLDHASRTAHRLLQLIGNLLHVCPGSILTEGAGGGINPDSVVLAAASIAYATLEPPLQCAP